MEFRSKDIGKLEHTQKRASSMIKVCVFVLLFFFFFMENSRRNEFYGLEKKPEHNSYNSYDVCHCKKKSNSNWL